MEETEFGKPSFFAEMLDCLLCVCEQSTKVDHFA